MPTAVTVLTSNVADPTGYGRIVRNREGEVVAFVEQKDADEENVGDHEVNSGVFAFDADVLRQALGQLDANNAQGGVVFDGCVVDCSKQWASGAGVPNC